MDELIIGRLKGFRESAVYGPKAEPIMATFMKPRRPPDLKGPHVSSKLTPGANLVGDDEQDTALLRRMLNEAEDYISSFSWCNDVLDSFFGGGVGGIFAIFLFHIRPTRRGIDPWIWIVVGDIPPAYLPLADCDSPAEVFRTYLQGMTKWVQRARK